MSWSVAAIGKAGAVQASIAKQFAGSKCSEPEESVRQAAASVLATAIAAQDPASAVKVTASGNQGHKYGPNGEATGLFTNSLSINVDPQYGFVE
jgi:hypothetical protein